MVSAPRLAVAASIAFAAAMTVSAQEPKFKARRRLSRGCSFARRGGSPASSTRAPSGTPRFR